ncbi:leucyl/phenylalanyl-tRNA--protein transferase [Alphaproteobacteria bacterium]|nr:leucyl/phenylalanyl-tRNA--protein transferase [Alphaproteobacteria bacterium]
MQLVLTPDLVLEAYRLGLFPMAYSADSPHINWVCPDLRGQLSIPDMHIPRRLLKTVKQNPYDVRVDSAFTDVIAACGEAAADRPETWINESIQDVFCKMHEQGHAHSVECWDGGQIVGGVYGLAIGGAFFGESMFSRARDASKIALVHLAARLWCGGFKILDTQFTNDHLEQFGVYEIEHDNYIALLNKALDIEADFSQTGSSGDDILNAYLDFRAG